MKQLDQVEIKLLNYAFKFKKLYWREEFAIKLTPESYPPRIILAHALLEVSGIVPTDANEALRVLDAMPIAIVDRVYRIWKGSFPASRRFTASRLYKAPEPLFFANRAEIVKDEGDSEHDRMMRSAEAKFGSQQMNETRELEAKILSAAKTRNGGYRGATLATTDKEPI
jgi:hypothetical protein